LAKYLRYYDLAFDEDLGKKYVQARLPSPNSVVALFQVEMGKCPSRGVTKLLVTFTETPGKDLTSRLRLSVLEVFVHLDIAAFSQYELGAKKRFFLDSILRCMTAYADTYGWDTARCLAVHKGILEAGIEFDRYWGKPVAKKAKGLTARAHVRFSESVDLSIVVCDTHGEVVARKPIATLPGSLGAIDDACGKLIWHDDTHLRLYRANGRDYWEYDITTGESHFCFPRAESGDPQGQYHLGVMYLHGHLVSQDRERALFWLRRSAEQNFKQATELLQQLEQAIDAEHATRIAQDAQDNGADGWSRPYP